MNTTERKTNWKAMLKNKPRCDVALKALTTLTPVEFEAFADQFSEQEREQLTDELLQIATGAGRLAGYLTFHSRLHWTAALRQRRPYRPLRESPRRTGCSPAKMGSTTRRIRHILRSCRRIAFGAVKG